MPPDNPKRTALIAEGMTEGEADYMLSGGAKDEGLNAADGAGVTTPAAPAEPSSEAGTAAAPERAAPVAVVAADDDDDATIAEGKPVPYQAFKRWKDRAKAARDEIKALGDAHTGDQTALRELQSKWDRLDERMRVFREATEAAADPAKAAQPVAPPDPEADPIAYLKYLGDQISGLGKKADDVSSHVQEREAATQLERSYVSDAQAFVRKTPDFGVAYDWLMKNRDAELIAAGIRDPQERARLIYTDERDIVARALTDRESPSERLYNLAKARGYAKPAAAVVPAANGAAGNGLAAVPANGAAALATNGAAASVSAQVDAINRGAAASRSLSSGGGAPPPQGVDLEKIASMGDEEYGEWKRSLTPAQRKEFSAMIGVMP